MDPLLGIEKGRKYIPLIKVRNYRGILEETKRQKYPLLKST